MGWLGKTASGVGLLLVCLLFFDIPSAYVVSRGYSWWLALAVGLLTFPVLPLVWHVFGERSRKRTAAAAKGPAKPAMTKGYERLLLRAATVGAAVVITLIAVARGAVWTAFRHHALWFVPDGAEPLVADSPLLRTVPPTANAVLWIRANDDARAELEPIFGRSNTDLLRASELVFAAGGNQMMIAERGDFEIVKTFSELFDSFPMYRPPILADKAVELPGGGRFWGSPDWGPTPKERPAALFALIPRAPDDAFLVGAALAGEGPAEDLFEDAGATAGVMWLRVHRHRAVFVLELDFPDDGTLTKARRELERELPRATGHACAAVSGFRESVETRGTTLRFEASVPLDQIIAGMKCLDPDWSGP